MELLNSFMIKDNIEINIFYDDFEGDIVALNSSQEIGRFCFRRLQSEDDSDDIIWLIHMNIENAFQKQGIGTAMIKAAVGVYGKFCVSMLTIGHNPIVTDGAALINSCIRKNIISNDFCVYEPSPIYF